MSHGLAHTIHRHHHHNGWDNANKPVTTVAPGETVLFETVDASGGQLGPQSTVADLAALDFGKVNPVTGPVFIDGAEPGDALRSSRSSSSRPRAGAGPATSRASACWPTSSPTRRCTSGATTRPSLAPALYGPGGKVPLKPFAGTIGVAPAEPGLHSIVPPRRVGGNMDIRDLAAGTDALPAGRGGRRPVLGRRHPRGAGRRRGLRHRHREPDERRPHLRSRQGRQPALSRASPRPGR